MKRKAGTRFLVITRREAAADKKLRSRGNNGRKVLVNDLYPDREKPALSALWKSANAPAKTPVVETGKGGIEITTFTQTAKQDRHKHLRGTECYVVLRGRMKIRLDEGQPLVLSAGDECVIFPGTVHEIIPAGKFLTRVHSIDCYGTDDKYVEKDGSWVLPEN
jgi:quercetin dioxygenase-like cupin family protein